MDEVGEAEDEGLYRGPDTATPPIKAVCMG